MAMVMLIVIVDGDDEREKIVTHKGFVDLCIFFIRYTICTL